MRFYLKSTCLNGIKSVKLPFFYHVAANARANAEKNETAAAASNSPRRRIPY